MRAAGIDALAGVPDAARSRASPSRSASVPGGSPSSSAARCAPRSIAGCAGNAAAFLKTAVLGDRRGIGPDVEDGVSRRGRDARPVGVGAAPGGGRGAAVLRRALGGGARAAVAALRRSARGRGRGGAARDRALRAGDRRGDRDAALGADAVDRHGRVPGRAARVGGAGHRGGGAGAAGGSPLELADPSLQLSLASVVGIALGARGIGPGRRWPPRRAARGARSPGCGASWRRRSRPRRRPRRWWRTTSARSRRCRRWATWRWFRSSSWRWSRRARGRGRGRDVGAAGHAAARRRRASRRGGAGGRGRFSRPRAALAVPRRRTCSRPRR